MEISDLILKNDEVVKLGKFSVLVGPNNVGKSQILKDIRARCAEGDAPVTTIVDRISLSKPESFNDLLYGLSIEVDQRVKGNHRVGGINSELNGGENIRVNLASLEEQFNGAVDANFILGNVSKYKVSYLNPSTRLTAASTQENTDSAEHPPKNLLQALSLDKDAEDSLRDVFKSTFNMDIALDYSVGKVLSVRVGKDFGDIPDHPREQRTFFKGYNALENEGDGFRSFVAVILSLLLSSGRVVLLDEPEAFLHPAQARQLGLWIAEHIANVPGQVIVATHNASFLSGIISSSHPVDIYRISRDDNNTSLTCMPSDAVSNLSLSPLLSSQRVLEAIFHKGVVVCEADADRAFYQLVATSIHKNNDVLFMHAHNKQTIPQVVSLLKSASVPVCAIADIDIINNQSDLLKVLESLDDDDYGEYKEHQKKIADSINSNDEAGILKSIQSDITTFLQELEEGKHNLSGARGALNRLRRNATNWKEVKTQGIEGIPKEVKDDGNKLIVLSKKKGLFIVPVGELEGWIDVGTKKKNKWIVGALERVAQGESPETLNKFISEIISYIEGR